jgi:seryl-tRNA synthetase
MLNGTMCAVSRVICAILENCQEEEGIAIPPALHPYLPQDMHFMKFVKPAPIDEKPEAKKHKKKGKSKEGNAPTETGCLEAKLKTLDVEK